MQDIAEKKISWRNKYGEERCVPPILLGIQINIKD